MQLSDIPQHYYEVHYNHKAMIRAKVALDDARREGSDATDEAITYEKMLDLYAEASKKYHALINALTQEFGSDAVYNAEYVAHNGMSVDDMYALGRLTAGGASKEEVLAAVEGTERLYPVVVRSILGTVYIVPSFEPGEAERHYWISFGLEGCEWAEIIYPHGWEPSEPNMTEPVAVVGQCAQDAEVARGHQAGQQAYQNWHTTRLIPNYNLIAQMEQAASYDAYAAGWVRGYEEAAGWRDINRKGVTQ